MIELIFVIVILGILAAVAIPKLAATRTDAESTAALASFKTAVSQVQSEALASGSVPSDLTAIIDGSKNLTVATTVFSGVVGTTTCATGTITGNNLVIAVPATTGGCALFADVSAQTIPLLGSAVTR